MRNHESAIGHNGGKRTLTPELSPHSTPQNPHDHPGQRSIHPPEPYNPFANVEETPSEGSVYSPPMFPVDKLDDGEIRFGNVDWIQRPEPTRSRNISDLDEVKLDGIPSNTNPPKPPFYRPVDSPPSHLASPPYTAAVAGQDLKSAGDRWSPHDEKHPTIATPPLTYYTPNKQENFRTNLDEKHTWDQTQNSADLQPFPEFEDVELARSNPLGVPSDPAAPVPMQIGGRRVSRRSAICFWIVFALIFLAPMAIALGIFGGVYHWNIKNEQCSMWGGSWHDDNKTCQYR